MLLLRCSLRYLRIYYVTPQILIALKHITFVVGNHCNAAHSLLTKVASENKMMNYTAVPPIPQSRVALPVKWKWKHFHLMKRLHLLLFAAVVICICHCVLFMLYSYGRKLQKKWLYVLCDSKTVGLSPGMSLFHFQDKCRTTFYG